MTKSALFIQRFFAFVVDMIIIFTLASLICIPFHDSNKDEELNNKSSNIVDEYISGKIDEEKYIKETGSIIYQSEKNNLLYSLISILLGIFYFIVYQFKTGQTIGKKLFKIKLESNSEKLTLNQMIVRGLVIDLILFDLIKVLFLLVSNNNSYFMGYISVMLVEWFILLVSAFMVMFRKDGRGLHDIVCNTKVIRVD